MKAIYSIAILFLFFSCSQASHKWDWLQAQDNVIPDSGEGTWPANYVVQPELNSEGDAVVMNAATMANVPTTTMGGEYPFSAISIEVVIMLNSHETWGGFMSFIQDNGAVEYGWMLGNYKQKFCFALATEGGDGLTYMNDIEDFEHGVWYHVVATYDGAEGQMNIFVNGKHTAYNDIAQSGNIQYSNLEEFWIGVYKDMDELHPMDGQMRYASLEHVALTPDEVASRYEHNVANGRPSVEQPSACVTVYDECYYNGNSFELCDDLADIDLDLVQSARIPQGASLTVYEETQYGGENVVYEGDVDCFTHNQASFLQKQQKGKVLSR